MTTTVWLAAPEEYITGNSIAPERLTPPEYGPMLPPSPGSPIAFTRPAGSEGFTASRALERQTAPSGGIWRLPNRLPNRPTRTCSSSTAAELTQKCRYVRLLTSRKRMKPGSVDSFWKLSGWLAAICG